MKNEIKQITDNILALYNKILLTEKKRIFTLKGVKLYPSETHLLLLVHQEGKTNATRMAEKLGVTKGAVSQILARLEKKGILQKFKDPYNKNEITLEFTKLGEDVFELCLQSVNEFYNHYEKCLSKLDEGERTVINNFLKEALIITDKVAGD